MPNVASKATFVTHPDFLSYPSTLDLAQFDGCVWALGKSQNGMKEAEYVTMTHDFPMAAANAIVDAKKAARGTGVGAGDGEREKPLRFVYYSGEGADQSGKSWVLFARVKVGTFAVLCLHPCRILMLALAGKDGGGSNKGQRRVRWDVADAYHPTRILFPRARGRE
jgi:hypothetical protein